ncbi:MAG: cupredoxin domain-containing protein [Chloroflexi bacterium]|nr:cupredoxin domain-containing protein [Chloroflexota bacterium]
MSRFVPGFLGILALAVLAAACGGGDGGERRVIQLRQTDENCTPATLEVGAGEKVTFEVTNDGKKDAEIEGIDGMRLEELLVPSGKTRSQKWTAPGSAGVQKLKCYVPGGQSTIIEVTVAAKTGVDVGGAADRASSRGTTKAPNATVTVDLTEYRVITDVASVAAGPTKFVARNQSKSEVHELAVLFVKADGSFDNMGEVEDIDPGKSGEIVLDLPKGKYVLACVIVPGEAGSKLDHYKEGMRLDWQVN